MKEIKAVSMLVSKGQDGDKLELFQVIGQGASSVVYRGRWRNLDVAVKTVIFANRHRDALGARQRAVTEVRGRDLILMRASCH